MLGGVIFEGRINMLVGKGKKVGEVFVDGGITYQVVSVLGDGNYISKKVDPIEVKKEKEFVEPKPKTTRKTTTKK